MKSPTWNGVSRVSAKKLKQLGHVPRSTVTGARPKQKDRDAGRATGKFWARRKKRSRAEDLRIYGPKEFRDFLHASECLGCGYRGLLIQQAHRQTGGVGRKDDWQRTGPLCGPRPSFIPSPSGGLLAGHYPGCHTLHDDAKRSWRTGRGETFKAAQEQFFAAWLAFSERGE